MRYALIVLAGLFVAGCDKTPWPTGPTQREQPSFYRQQPEPPAFVDNSRNQQPCIPFRIGQIIIVCPVTAPSDTR